MTHEPSNEYLFRVLRDTNATDAETEEAFDKLLDRNELEECEQCGCHHPKNFTGDCRDDYNRF